jgi:hypothetical protein
LTRLSDRSGCGFGRCADSKLDPLARGRVRTYAHAMIRPIRAACVSLVFVLAGCQQSTSVPRDSRSSPDILLFNGTGISRNGVAALEALLTEHGFRYDTIDLAGGCSP